MKRIKFSVSRVGEVTVIDAEGYGAGCQTATARLEQRLGGADESTRASTESLYELRQAREADLEQG